MDQPLTKADLNELHLLAVEHAEEPNHEEDCSFCRWYFGNAKAEWSAGKVSRVNFNLNALKIAASVFSQINDCRTIVPEAAIGVTAHPFTEHLPRTLKDFRESVDAVFKAAGLEKVEWE